MKEYPAALVSHPDPARGPRAIKWALQHLFPGEEPLLWISRKRDLENDAALLAFSKRYPVATGSRALPDMERWTRDRGPTPRNWRTSPCCRG